MDALLVGALISLRVRDRGELPAWLTRRHFQLNVLVIFLADAVSGSMQLEGTALAVRLAAHWSVTAIASAALLCAVLSARHAREWPRIMQSSFLRFFGKYSYAIYVFHLAVINAIPKLVKVAFAAVPAHDKAAVPLILFGVIALGITTCISLVSWQLIEKPFLDLKEKFFPFAFKAPLFLIRTMREREPITSASILAAGYVCNEVGERVELHSNTSLAQGEFLQRLVRETSAQRAWRLA